MSAPSPLICIYCNNPKEDSESHIIPEGLGQGPTLTTGVCKDCNNQINRTIEQPILSELAPIRNFLQLDGKKRKRAAIELEASFGDKKQKISVRDPRDLKNRLFVFEDVEHNGQKRALAIIAKAEKIPEIKKDFAKRKPGMVWEDIEIEDIEIPLNLYLDLSVFSSSQCLRMVAKIALEWWAKKRTIGEVKSNDYLDIRNFIKDNQSSSHPLVSITNNPKVLGAMSGIPFGIHTLFCAADPRSTNLVIIVGLFSLVYYKIFLSRNHPRIAKIEELATVNPQTGIVYEPSIRLTLGSGPYVSGIDPCDKEKPEKILEEIRADILRKLNDGMQNIRDSNR